MSVLGIVAEYDPFHNGHLFHLRSAMEAVSPSAVLVALSGPFKQRGEIALLSPFVRAECALSSGADAVFMLPSLWTVRDAAHYALGAVSVLASLGATHLAFGAENADLSLLQQTADLLEDSPEKLTAELHRELSLGKGYPAALSAAVGACIPESRELLNHANNILAVCYLRAIRRLNLSITPVVIHRFGSYHAAVPFPSSPSASSIRDSLCRGNWSPALSCLPEVSSNAVLKSFRFGRIPSRQSLDSLLLNKLRSMSAEQISRLPDCSEGLETAVSKAAAESFSREELIARLTGRRYSSSRISRLCACALLDLTREQVDYAPLPSGILLLGIKKNLSLTGSWKNGPVQVLTASKWRNVADPADLAAWRLWCQACGFSASYPFTQRI